MYETPYPHFSYHVAVGYDRARLRAVLTQAAARARPFTVTTTGLAAFTQPQPVLYMPVVRTAELSALHAELWAALQDAATESQAYYAPPRWVPHITLAAKDLTPASAAQAFGRLASRSFDWEIPVDNLAYLDDENGLQHVRESHALRDWR